MGIHLTKVTAPYLIRKRGMFYLQKRVPKALVGHYGKEFIRKSLRTRDRLQAIRISSQLVTALEKEWSDKLFAIPDGVPATMFLSEPQHTVPVLSAALTDYCTMKGRQNDKRFMVFTQRVAGEVISIAGDKLISAYSRADALAFRDRLLGRGVTTATVKRNFECIRAIWNYSAREHGLVTANPFANMNYGNGSASVTRKPIPIENIRRIQQVCFETDDDIRWLVALLSDTGMRLAEAAGLAIFDFHLDAEIPFVRLSGHHWRRLKTKGSQRDIPLIGASLWAANRVVANATNEFAFPRYCSLEGCKADYASNTLNKWLRKYVPEGCVVHSFRHSMRDRLRAVQCPVDMIDQIGGWATAGVGHKYGDGHNLFDINLYISRLILVRNTSHYRRGSAVENFEG